MGVCWELLCAHMKSHKIGTSVQIIFPLLEQATNLGDTKIDYIKRKYYQVQQMTAIRAQSFLEQTFSEMQLFFCLSVLQCVEEQ